MELGKRLRDRREELRLTQAGLADRADITPNTVSMIERGHSIPSIKMLLRLADALDVEPGELLSRPKVVALPSTPLVDTAPEDLDERLRSAGSAATVEELQRVVEAEERDLLIMARRVRSKLDRALVYRMAITDRWVKLADEKRDPRSNRFKSVLEIAGEVAANQEWLKDQQDGASRTDTGEGRAS
jgi:transcriptional regulator with XRE-family HTH domain